MKNTKKRLFHTVNAVLRVEITTRPAGLEPATYGLEILLSGCNCFVHKHLNGDFEPKKRVASNNPISNKLLTTRYPLLTDELFDELLKSTGYQKEMVVQEFFVLMTFG